MPFKSKAQWRACFAADDPNWDCREWADSTPSYKELPKKKKKEKKADYKVEDQTFTDSDGAYNVADLYELAKSKGEPQNLDISDLLHNLEPSPEEKGEELPGHPDFVARAEAAGTLPGIAVNYPDGKWIADGVHRLWKAQQDNKKEYPAYVLDKADIGSVKQANLDALLEAKKESDRKNYSAKHDILRKLINQNPANFIIDSAEGNISGITHTPTGFQIHMPSDTIPSGVALKQAAEKKATAPGTEDITQSTVSVKSASTMLGRFLVAQFNQRVTGTESVFFKENAHMPMNAPATDAGGLPGFDTTERDKLKAQAQAFVPNKQHMIPQNAAASAPASNVSPSEVAPNFGLGRYAGGTPALGHSLSNSQFGNGAGVQMPKIAAAITSLLSSSLRI